MNIFFGFNKFCDSCYLEGFFLNEFNECDPCEKCKRCNIQRRDYLNQSQICNSCCEEIEQMTPSDFKPNVKFEYCKGRCYQRKDYLNKFNECEKCEKCERCNNQRKDYANEFQICDSCFKQIEQMTPSDFKPNVKFEHCKGGCYQRKDYLNEFNECEKCEKCEKCNDQRREYLEKYSRFLICNSCHEQMTTKGFKPNFKFEECKRCNQKSDYYLNEFQICNSCCKKMEQVTPNGFNPNVKFEYCRRCYQRKDYLNESNECEKCEKCEKCNNQRKDYLNEFQICDSCFKQMEQITPSDFKPNVKFEHCKGRCYQRKDYLNEFNECEKCEKCEKCNNQRKDYLNKFQICDSCFKQIEQMTPSDFKPNVKFEYCKGRCYLKRDYLNEFNECNFCEKCKRCNNQKRDYLNKFQVCNLCWKQMEQITPSGFKPNHKFEECKRCYQRNDYLNEFDECDSCEKCKRCNNQRDYLNKYQFCNSCCEDIEQMTPSGFKPNFNFKKCKKCDSQRGDYLNEFQICISCYKQMEQMTPDGFKLNIKFEECKKCDSQRGDYLNEFQICNFCYKKMEQATPNGFNPNIKFEKCKRCNQKRDCLNEFKICNLCYEQQMRNFLPSGNEVIDNFIRYTLNHERIGEMKFVPYYKFNDVKFIAEGGFSKIYKAIWIDGLIKYWDSDHNSEMVVALKELNNSKDISKELNELKIYHNLVLRCNKDFINRYYGITQHPISNNFMIIMIYYEFGDLVQYLNSDFFNISWYNKLKELFYIISGIEELHNANILHKDLHSGNIFLNTNKVAIIGDLGISKSAMDDDDDEIYGIIPYIAPEVLKRQKYTKASDIYSCGMIMWELMTGRRPFWDQDHDTDLIIEIIFNELRPPIVSNAPEGYIQLMQECLHSDPKKRPTANELKSKVMACWINETKNPTKIIESSDIGLVKTKYPGAIYKSRPLSAMIKSAKSTRNLISQMITLTFDKRKFDDHDLVEDKPTKKIKFEKEDNDYMDSSNNDYTTKEISFDI